MNVHSLSGFYLSASLRFCFSWAWLKRRAPTCCTTFCTTFYLDEIFPVILSKIDVEGRHIGALILRSSSICYRDAIAFLLSLGLKVHSFTSAFFASSFNFFITSFFLSALLYNLSCTAGLLWIEEFVMFRLFRFLLANFHRRRLFDIYFLMILSRIFNLWVV